MNLGWIGTATPELGSYGLEVVADELGDTVGELDRVGVGLEVGLGVGVGVADGDADADGDGDGDAEEEVVADGVADGLLEGEWEGVAGAELPWAGPTRLGVCTWWPV